LYSDFIIFNQATKWEPVLVVRKSLKAANPQLKVETKALRHKIRQDMPLHNNKNTSKHPTTMDGSKMVNREALRPKKWTPSILYQMTYPLIVSTQKGARLLNDFT